MQSEFACHIGLKGKFFCRACWVKGSDALRDKEDTSDGKDGDASDGTDGDASETNDSVSDGGSDTGDHGHGVTASAKSVPKKPKGRVKKTVESLASMVTRLKDFIKVNHLSVLSYDHSAYHVPLKARPPSQ